MLDATEKTEPPDAQEPPERREMPEPRDTAAAQDLRESRQLPAKSRGRGEQRERKGLQDQQASATSPTTSPRARPPSCKGPRARRESAAPAAAPAGLETMAPPDHRDP